MSEHTGFYRAEHRDGRWWLLDPAGRPTISKGVDNVQFSGDRIDRTERAPYHEACTRKYGDLETWRQAAAGRLLGWGFNTLGAWSDNELAKVTHEGRQLAYSVTLDFGSRFVTEKTGRNAWLEGGFPDAFDPDFAALARRLAAELVAPRKDHPQLLGWFTDNELHWDPDWVPEFGSALLGRFLNLPAGAPGRQAAIGLLERRYGQFSAFESVWRTGYESWARLAAVETVSAPFSRNLHATPPEPREQPRYEAFLTDCDAFLALLAERYFRTCTKAIREVDPDHLIMGPRFAVPPVRPVVEAAARALDVIAFNCYDTDPTGVIRGYEVFGLPLIIGEFSFRGQDAGLPNTRGAGPRVPTQQARADAFESYVRTALATPNVVGYHWFQHADQPKEGRFDGEDSNYGVVNGEDEVYGELTERMAEVNAGAEEMHQ